MKVSPKRKALNRSKLSSIVTLKTNQFEVLLTRVIDFVGVMSEGSPEMVAEKRGLRGLVPPVVAFKAEFGDRLWETVLAVY